MNISDMLAISLNCREFLFTQVLVEKLKVPGKREQEEIAAKRLSDSEKSSMSKLQLI